MESFFPSIDPVSVDIFFLIHWMFRFLWGEHVDVLVVSRQRAIRSCFPLLVWMSEDSNQSIEYD